MQVPDENGENRDGRGNDYVQSATTEPEADIAIAETSEPIEKQYPLESGTLYYKIYNETHLANPTADAWERILEEGEITIEQLFAGEVIALPQPETPDAGTDTSADPLLKAQAEKVIFQELIYT